jgi:putative ABC transport system permease protein
MVDDREVEVIGVVGDSAYGKLHGSAEPHMYLPLAQYYLPRATLLVKSSVPPRNIMAAIRQQVCGLDRSLPVFNVRTLEEHVNEYFSQSRMTALYLTFFGILAVSLAAVGIYGVMSYSVNRRTREIGIRMALGAKAGDVLTLVVEHGLKLALAGVAVGLGGALALNRVISSLLYGVNPTDPLTFGSVSLLVTVVAFVACYIPARRATKVDPMVALRYE